MNNCINICLDLGSDTLKVTSAYSMDGREYVDKVCTAACSDAAIPAIARYNISGRGDKAWTYGYEIGRCGEVSFSTVVKIKPMLLLVCKNRDFYEKGNKFPYFAFPITYDIDERYYTGEKMPLEKRQKYDALHFTAEGWTPQKLCINYFKYVADILKKYLKTLSSHFRFAADILNSACIKYTLIYPTKLSKKEIEGITRGESEDNISEYIQEYENIFRKGMGIKTDNVNVSLLSEAKALAMVAVRFDSFGRENGKDVNESALLFDIGEECISVVKLNKVNVKGEVTFSVDGASGHNMPQKLGGNDIDEVLGEEIEKSIRDREIMGNENKAEMGDNALKSKEYLFLKSIKHAKSILSSKGATSNYPKGVAVSTIRDVEVFKNISQANMSDWLGIGCVKSGKKYSKVSSTVAEKIAHYIVSELSDHASTNKYIKRVYISGGVANTYGLVDAIRSAVKNEDVNAYREIKTFDDCCGGVVTGGVYGLKEDDISTYVLSMGGALSSLYDFKMKMILTKSYALRLFYRDRNDSGHLELLVERGTDLNFEPGYVRKDNGIYDDNKKREHLIFTTGVNVYANSDEIIVYTTDITKEDIQQRAYANIRYNGYKLEYRDYKTTLYLYMPDTDDPRWPAFSHICGLVPVAGDENTRINCYYKNKKQKITEFKSLMRKKNGRFEVIDNEFKPALLCTLGISIDKAGVATVFIKNNEGANRDKYLQFDYIDERNRRCPNEVANCSDIIVDFTDKLVTDSGSGVI